MKFVFRTFKMFETEVIHRELFIENFPSEMFVGTQNIGNETFSL